MSKSLFSILAAAAVLVACNKTEVQVTSESIPIRFSATTNQYVMKSTDVNSPIDNSYNGTQYVGIFASSPIGKDNQKYSITSSTALTAVDSENPIAWPAGASGSSVFISYFPWIENINSTSQSVTVNTDQTELANLNGSDFLRGQTSAISAGTTAVNLSLNHLYTKVVVSISSTMAIGVQGVTIKNIDNAGTLNLSTGAISDVDTQTSNVQMYQTSNTGIASYSFAAIVLPQTATTQIEVKMTDNTTYTFELEDGDDEGTDPDPFTYVSGQQATAALTLTPATVSGTPINYSYQVGEWGSNTNIAINSTPQKGSVANKWSVIGHIMGTDWNQDFYMTQQSEPSTNLWVLENVTLAAGDCFKLRYNNSYDTNAGMKLHWNSYALGEFNDGGDSAATNYLAGQDYNSYSGTSAEGRTGNQNIVVNVGEAGYEKTFKFTFNATTYQFKIEQED